MSNMANASFRSASCSSVRSSWLDFALDFDMVVCCAARSVEGGGAWFVLILLVHERTERLRYPSSVLLLFGGAGVFPTQSNVPFDAVPAREMTLPSVTQRHSESALLLQIRDSTAEIVSMTPQKPPV
jgi:hypothetical protein